MAVIVGLPQDLLGDTRPNVWSRQTLPSNIRYSRRWAVLDRFPAVYRPFESPQRSRAVVEGKWLPLDEIEDALQRSAAMQNARGILVRKQQKMSGRPVTPLHKGHVGLLACSGMLNGFFGEGDMRHIAHWRSVKHVDEFNEEGETEGEAIIRKRERFSHELTLAYESGRILELKETKDTRAQPNASK